MRTLYAKYNCTLCRFIIICKYDKRVCPCVIDDVMISMDPVKIASRYLNRGGSATSDACDAAGETSST